ncbi:MAG TPA: hypothetical protein PLR60_12425 [Syntrophorhabdaceae bacterium]|nr:hypothetical protein [Syntrophorhabdaceae bacterium]
MKEHKNSPTKKPDRRKPEALKEWGRRWMKAAQKHQIQHRKTQATTGSRQG